MLAHTLGEGLRRGVLVAMHGAVPRGAAIAHMLVQAVRWLLHLCVRAC